MLYDTCIHVQPKYVSKPKLANVSKRAALGEQQRMCKTKLDIFLFLLEYFYVKCIF